MLSDRAGKERQKESDMPARRENVGVGESGKPAGLGREYLNSELDRGPLSGPIQASVEAGRTDGVLEEQKDKVSCSTVQNMM